MRERVELQRKTGPRGLLITSYKRLKKDSDRAMTPVAEAVRVPAHLVLPGSLQVKQLCHLHAQCSLGQSCRRQKKVLCLCEQGRLLKQSKGLFGQSFSIALPIQALRGLPCLGSFSVLLAWVLHCRSARNTNQMLKAMCAEDSYGIPRLGEIPQVEAITAESLFAHYRKILTESPVHVFYIGSAQPETVADVLKPMLSKLAKNPICLPAQTGFAPVPFSEHEEILDVAQGKLCLGYATPINLRHPDYPAVQVCNTILGAGMTSKLFMQVREKMSLCYDIGSGFHGSKGIMTVAAGIEFEKKEIVQQEIFHQLQEICEGNITQEELTAAKEALLSNLRATHDSPGAIEGYYASAAISGIGMTPAAFMEAIVKVSPQDVSRAAKTLQLQTIYFLKGEQ